MVMDTQGDDSLGRVHLAKDVQNPKKFYCLNEMLSQEYFDEAKYLISRIIVFQLTKNNQFIRLIAHQNTYSKLGYRK